MAALLTSEHFEVPLSAMYRIPWLSEDESSRSIRSLGWVDAHLVAVFSSTSSCRLFFETGPF